jgi:hypothetical protein
VSYDLVKSIRNLMQQEIGDAPRLEYILDRLEKGKYLYLSDQKYLENLLNENEMRARSHETEGEPHSLEKLETDLKNLNTQLEKILQIRERNEKTTSDFLRPVEDPPKQTIADVTVRPQRKSEDITLVLSVVLGLVSLQGIGHIYIGKIARGAGILSLSLLLFTIWISYVTGIITKSSIPSFASFYFLPVIAAGYLGLYVFQILDGRKLCATYNQYISEQGKRPPWW